MCSMLHFAGVCDGVEPMYPRASLAHPVYAKHRQIAITAAVRPPPATAQHDAWRQRPTGWWRHFLRWWRTTSGRRLFPQLPLRGWGWLFGFLPVWWGGRGGNTRGWGCTPLCTTRHKQPASHSDSSLLCPGEISSTLSLPWFLYHVYVVSVSLVCLCVVTVMLWSHLVEDERSMEDGAAFRAWKTLLVLQLNLFHWCKYQQPPQNYCHLSPIPVWGMSFPIKFNWFYPHVHMHNTSTHTHTRRSTVTVLGFIHIGAKAKATSLPVGFIENSI